MENKVLIIVLTVILVALVVMIYFTTDNKEQDIEFALKDLTENEISLYDFKGKKVFLNFWATWCPPCNMEMPFINEIYKENNEIEIITISSNEDKKTVQEYMQNNNYEFRVLLDLDGKIAKKYKAYSIPMSILIDEDGNIIDTHIGAMEKDELIKFMQLM